MLNKNKYIDIEFSYNGDLGKLQHQTQANLNFIQNLLYAEVITREDYQELGNQIIEYFKNKIQHVVDNPLYYTRNF